MLAAFFVVFAFVASADDSMKNRTEVTFLHGLTIIADTPLPDKVYEAQKYKIMVITETQQKGSRERFISYGTAPIVAPGYVITARHVISKKVECDLTGAQCDFSAVGEIISDDRIVVFPLSLVAYGPVGSLQDVAAFRLSEGLDIVYHPPQADKAMPDLFAGDGDRRANQFPSSRVDNGVVELVKNPYRILLHEAEFTDLAPGEAVTVSGFHTTKAPLLSKDGTTKGVFVDVFNYNFSGQIAAAIRNMEANKSGSVNTVYRIRGTDETAFSGGMVLSADGKIGGMVNASIKNFVYALSAKDIREFLKAQKILK